MTDSDILYANTCTEGIVPTEWLSLGKEYRMESTLHRISVGDLYFSQEGKPRLRYTPKEDITPYELARMIQLFAIAFVPNVAAYYDYWKYIEEYNLVRHFEEM